MTEASTPERPGWYWFLPNKNTPTPTGLLRLKAVVIYVGQYQTPDSKAGQFRLVVRFQDATYDVQEIGGKWSNRLIEPDFREIK